MDGEVHRGVFWHSDPYSPAKYPANKAPDRDGEISRAFQKEAQIMKERSHREIGNKRKITKYVLPDAAIRCRYSSGLSAGR